MRRFRNHSDFREEVAKVRISFESNNSQVADGPVDRDRIYIYENFA